MSEESLLRSLHSGSSPALDALFLVSHWIGGVWASAALVLGIALWLRLTGERRSALAWLAAGVLVVAVLVLLKQAVARPRPRLWATLVRPEGFAFPSGHALASAAFYPLLARTLAGRGRLGGRLPRLVLAVGPPAFIGLGRLYLGVHWPTDVLSGWALGGAVAVAAIQVMRPRPAAAARG